VAEGGVGEEEEGAGGQEAGQRQVEPQPAPPAQSGHSAAAGVDAKSGDVWKGPQDIFLFTQSKVCFLEKRL